MESDKHKLLKSKFDENKDVFNEFMKFCFNQSEEIFSILNHYNKIYSTLLDSSKDIEKVFKSALTVLYNEQNVIPYLKNR